MNRIADLKSLVNLSLFRYRYMETMNFPFAQWIFNNFNLSLMAGPKYGFPRHNHHHLETRESSDAEAEVSCFSATEQVQSEDQSPVISATSSPRTAVTSAPAGYSVLPGASLASPLVYAVVFVSTLLYVGVWLTKW